MHINDIAGSFLFEGLQPSQTMIGHLLEMEVLDQSTSIAIFIHTCSCLLNQSIYGVRLLQ